MGEADDLAALMAMLGLRVDQVPAGSGARPLRPLVLDLDSSLTPTRAHAGVRPRKTHPDNLPPPIRSGARPSRVSAHLSRHPVVPLETR